MSVFDWQLKNFRLGRQRERHEIKAEIDKMWTYREEGNFIPGFDAALACVLKMLDDRDA